MKLESLPEAVGELKSLEELDLSDTNLESLPEGISKLTKLDEQSMQGILVVCKSMTELPEDLFEHPYFSALTKLDFSDWKMQSLPASIGNCIALQTLICWGCKELQSLPPS